MQVAASGSDFVERGLEGLAIGGGSVELGSEIFFFPLECIACAEESLTIGSSSVELSRELFFFGLQVAASGSDFVERGLEGLTIGSSSIELGSEILLICLKLVVGSLQVIAFRHDVCEGPKLLIAHPGDPGLVVVESCLAHQALGFQQAIQILIRSHTFGGAVGARPQRAESPKPLECGAS